MAREQRRLAAILAADVVGFSRLMGQDESGTLARLKDNRAARFDPAIAQYGGRLVKLTGDGALVEFPSAVDALSAAIVFQQAMLQANRDQPEERCLMFRIGLHLGDLIVDGDDLYGEGVNIAARLEAAAAPGTIWLSGNIHDAVAGRLHCSFEDLGMPDLKNIDRPVRAFRAIWEAADWQNLDTMPPSTGTAAGLPAGRGIAAEAPLALPDKPSVAVLPFANMSGDAEQEYFADGITEDIITALSRFRSMFVIARNSSFTYKGRSVDIRTVGRELGVRYVLEGSVRKSGNRVRITGQLIQADSAAHIWAERYDGDLTDIFALQDRVTSDVVGAIAPRLEQAEIERARSKPTDNLGAYDLYLRGMARIHARTPDDIMAAREFGYRAIALDAGYAAAHAMIAYADAFRIGVSAEVPAPEEVIETARLARRAVELAPDDSGVLTMAAWALTYVVRELETGAGFAERALRLNPNLAMTYFVAGWIAVWQGQHETGLERATMAMRLNPLDPNLVTVRSMSAHACYMLRRYDGALAEAEANLREKQTLPSLRIAAAAAAQVGRLTDARRYIEHLLERDPTRRLSNLEAMFGPYRRPQDIAHYKEGLRLAGLPE